MGKKITFKDAEVIRGKVPISKTVDTGEDGILKFVINSGELDRENEMLDIPGLETKAYEKMPVVAFAHKYDQPTIGKALSIWKENFTKKDGSFGTRLVGLVKYAIKEYEFANTIYKLAKGGYLPAVSIGFRPIEGEDLGDGVIKYTKAEMLEFSNVVVGADAGAGIVKGLGIDIKEVEAVEKGKVSIEDYHIKKVKTAIPYSVHGDSTKAPEDAPWDAGAQVRQAEGAAQLKKMHAWMDAEGDPESKSTYKLPHHTADGNKVVWRGVSAAMAAMLGARGGVRIPEGDRSGVYNHLAKHYKQFDKEVPELKEYSEDELEKMFESEDRGAKDIINLVKKATTAVEKFNSQTESLSGRDKQVAIEKAYEASKLVNKCSELLNKHLREEKRRIVKRKILVINSEDK